MKLTWNPQAIQISSTVAKSKFPYLIPFATIQECFIYLTPRLLPDLITATQAPCNKWFLANCSSDIANIGCKTFWLYFLASASMRYPLSRVFKNGIVLSFSFFLSCSWNFCCDSTIFVSSVDLSSLECPVTMLLPRIHQQSWRYVPPFAQHSA